MGMPASRITDKVAGNVIVSGSGSVLIGDSASGSADTACKGSPSVGAPVNPILGIKVLPSETDFALEAPSPFAFTRSYASDDARIGPLGHGWAIPGSLSLEVTETSTVMTDLQGRRITFGPLSAGASLYSTSEMLWLRRGGAGEWTGPWSDVSEDVRNDERHIVALSSLGGDYFIFKARRTGPWLLSQTTNRNGYATEFQWSATGELRSVCDSAGRVYALVFQRALAPTNFDSGLRLGGVVLAYDPSRDKGPRPPLIAIADNADWLVRYAYDERGDLVEVRNRAGDCVRIFAWHHHLLVRHGEPGGIDVRYTYDDYRPQGRVLTQVNADGLSYRFDYADGLTRVTDSLGRVEDYHFTGSGGLRRLTAHVRADGSRVVWEHDAAGRVLAETDPLGRVTRYRLDGEGRQIGVTRPDRSTLSIRLDPETGDELERETAPGRRVRFVRDQRGNVITEVAPDGAETRYLYENSALPDRPTQIVDALGGVRRLGWDAMGLLVQLTDCSGHTTRYTHDHTGRLTSVADALGHTTRHERDRMGRLLSTTGPGGSVTRLGYDALGRVIRRTDALGQATCFAHDRFGRVIRRVDPQGFSLAWAYDDAGRLVKLTNENGADYRFRHDVMDQLIEEIGYDGRRQRYLYNDAGELIEHHDAGDLVTRHEHDAMGRTVRVHVPATLHAAAHTQHFVYDTAGQMTEARTPEVTVIFRHDAAGRLLGETQRHADGWQYHCEHRYNARGVREATRYGDLPEVQWLTYGPGHLHGVRVGGVGLDFERDALHREVGRRGVLADATPGFESRSTHDAAGYLIGQQVSVVGDRLIWTRAYRNDLTGKVIAIRDKWAGLNTYRYDPSGRLVGSDLAGRSRNYLFDPAGNRLFGADSLDIRPETWPDNRIRRFDDLEYQHDVAGNVIRRVQRKVIALDLAYDALHRMVHVNRIGMKNDSTASYVYDAFGRRIRKEVTFTDGEVAVERFGWDGDRLSARVRGRQQLTVLYAPGSFVPLLCLTEQTKPEVHFQGLFGEFISRHGLTGCWSPIEPVGMDATAVCCCLGDHLGTPLQWLDLSGDFKFRGIADDWGGVQGSQGIAPLPIRFQGQYLDEESGLYYNRFRYYDPEAGRYLTQDPVGLLGGSNLYVYAENVPTVQVDAMGLQAFLPGLLGMFGARPGPLLPRVQPPNGAGGAGGRPFGGNPSGGGGGKGGGQGGRSNSPCKGSGCGQQEQLRNSDEVPKNDLWDGKNVPDQMRQNGGVAQPSQPGTSGSTSNEILL